MTFGLYGHMVKMGTCKYMVKAFKILSDSDILPSSWCEALVTHLTAMPILAFKRLDSVTYKAVICIENIKLKCAKMHVFENTKI